MLSSLTTVVNSTTSRTRLRVAIAAGLFALYCAVLAGSSSPRRVGDGVEYWAMAEQMRTGHRPSATRPELARLEREVPAIGAGYDRSPLRFPHLVGADGRQDFPHFWLYPLLNVPALALVSALGAHPNWAFTLTNIVLLAAAFAIVARRVSMAWAILLLAGPLIWWVDKAHGDVFTVTLLAAACAWWKATPERSVIAVALAAAQNPALMPVSAMLNLAALCSTFTARTARAERTERAEDAESAKRLTRRRQIAVTVGVGIAAMIVAVPLAYYKIRLGVWSPLIGYTHPTWPSIRAVLSLLADLNVGLLPNAPFVAIAGLWAIAARALARRTRRDDDASAPSSWLEWMLLAGACVLMLAAFAQSVNLNHGATPGLNRWTLWLTPWLLLIVPTADGARAVMLRRDGDAPRRRIAGARLLTGLAALNIVWGAWFFRPSLPEVYRYPTIVASWAWRHAPRWYAPSPEIFAERVSHREPATLPVATPGCTKVLIIDGRWPTSCVPTAPAPPECLGAERLCYATPTPTPTTPMPTRFTPLGDVTFPWTPAARAWDGNAPFVAALHAALRVWPATPDGRQADAFDAEAADDVIRAMHAVGWATAWSDDARTRLAIYVQDVSTAASPANDSPASSASPASSSAASLDLRVDSDYSGHLIDLDTGRTLAPVTLARSIDQPSTLALPSRVQHGLVRLERLERTR